MHCAYHSGDAALIEIFKNANAKECLEAVVLPSLMHSISSKGILVPQASDYRPWQWDTRFSPSLRCGYMTLSCLPFHLAIVNGHLALIDRLVRYATACHGAIMPELSEDSLKALCASQNILDDTLLATIFDQPSSLAKYLKSLESQKFGGQQRVALQAALVLGSSRCLEVILNQVGTEKISWDDANQEIEYSITIAESKQDTACLQKLLSRCAQPEDHAKCSVLRTVLHTQTHALDCLLEHWQLPTAAHWHYGLTLLAANLETEQIMRKLILHGLDINAIPQPSAPEECCSPLMEAAKKGHAALVERLVEHGASVDLMNKYGQSALGIAARYGHAVVVSILLEHGAAPDLRLKHGHIAVLSPRSESVSTLLNHGASPDVQDESGATPLILAACEGQIHEMTLLLDGGASVDLQDHGGETALLSLFPHFYCRLTPRKEVISLSLEYDASVAIRNDEGIDALEACLDLESPDERAKCIQLILEALDDRMRRSMTPLHRYLETARQLQIGGLERNHVNLDVAQAELPQHLRERFKEIQKQGGRLPDSTDWPRSTAAVPLSASKKKTKSAEHARNLGASLIQESGQSTPERLHGPVP